jgi:hypothetical protein
MDGQISMRSNARHIDDWDGPGTGFTTSGARVFIDSLTLLCWHRLPEGVLQLLRQEYGRRLILKCHVITVGRRRRRRYWLITIHQPRKATLQSLRPIQRRRFVINTVHIATDFLCPNQRQAALATEFLTRNLLLKWRRRGHRSHLEPNTRYWNRDKKAVRNFALYGHRPSKTGRGACAHFEMRFAGAAACKRAGIGKLDDLVRGVDAMTLLHHQARIMPIDSKRLDRAIEAIARRTLRNKKHLGATVNEIKLRVQERLARILSDQDRPLSAGTVARARSQNLWDYQPVLRPCLKRMPWDHFTSDPSWHWW